MLACLLSVHVETDVDTATCRCWHARLCLAVFASSRMHSIFRTLTERIMQVPAGALVVLHGSNVHFSRPNRSPCSRHAYTMHVVDGDAAWAPHNWCAQTRLTSGACDVAWVPVEGHAGVGDLVSVLAARRSLQRVWSRVT